MLARVTRCVNVSAGDSSTEPPASGFAAASEPRQKLLRLSPDSGPCRTLPGTAGEGRDLVVRFQRGGPDLVDPCPPRGEIDEELGHVRRRGSRCLGDGLAPEEQQR